MPGGGGIGRPLGPSGRAWSRRWGDGLARGAEGRARRALGRGRRRGVGRLRRGCLRRGRWRRRSGRRSRCRRGRAAGAGAGGAWRPGPARSRGGGGGRRSAAADQARRAGGRLGGGRRRAGGAAAAGAATCGPAPSWPGRGRAPVLDAAATLLPACAAGGSRRGARRVAGPTWPPSRPWRPSSPRRAPRAGRGAGALRRRPCGGRGRPGRPRWRTSGS